MDLDNPDWLTQQLMKLDPAYFYAAMTASRLTLKAVDAALDLAFGYTVESGTREERNMAKRYESSAQLVDILGRGAFSVLYNHQLHNFLWKHRRYVHPEYVLGRDDVTLHGVTSTHAFFCVSKYDVYDPKTFPFTFLLQFLQSQQMVIMPHESFNRLADDLGDPKDRHITLLNMTARCGSTLLSQMLSRVPGVRVQSEPWAFTHLYGFYSRKLLSLPQYRRLLRSVMRLQCKPEGRGDTHLFVKMSNFAGPCMPILKELFPDVQQMFITRRFRESMLSYFKVMRGLPKWWYRLDRTRNFWRKHMTVPIDDPKWWDFHDKETWKFNYEEGIAMTLAASIDAYLMSKENYAKAILYEDLKEHPRREAKEIFRLMGLSEDHLEDALEAMKEDSQKGVLGIIGNAHVKLTKKEESNMVDMLRRTETPIHMHMSVDEYRELIRLDAKVYERVGDRFELVYKRDSYHDEGEEEDQNNNDFSCKDKNKKIISA